MTGLEDEDEEGPATTRREQRRDRVDDVDVDEDEFADFLDDDDEEGAGEGRQRRRRAGASGLPAGISSAAVAVRRSCTFHPFHTFATAFTADKILCVCSGIHVSGMSGGVWWLFHMQEAQDIFGDVTDLLEEYTQRRQQPGEDDIDELDEEMEDEDEEAAEERLRLKVSA